MITPILFHFRMMTSSISLLLGTATFCFQSNLALSLALPSWQDFFSGLKPFYNEDPNEERGFELEEDDEEGTARLGFVQVRLPVNFVD